MSVKRSVSEIEIESVQDQPSVAVGSFFKGFRAPSDTTFDLYKKKKSEKDEFVLHGENERLEYEGYTDSSSQASNQYVVGLFNP